MGETRRFSDWIKETRDQERYRSVQSMIELRYDLSVLDEQIVVGVQGAKILFLTSFEQD